MRPSKDQIVNLSREEIAEKFDVSLRTAVRWQKHHDLFSSKINRLTQPEADKIRECYIAGMSVKECQAKFGYSLTTIYRVLNNLIFPSDQSTAQISVSYNPDA